MITPFINAYIAFNGMLILIYLFLRIFKLRPVLKLDFCYWGLLFALLCSGFQSFFPRASFTNSTVKIWAGENMEQVVLTEQAKPQAMSLSLVSQSSAVPKHMDSIFVIMALAILGLFTFRMIKDYLLIRNIIENSFLFKRKGKVDLLIYPDLPIPFSFWKPGHYVTVVPSSLITQPAHMRTAFYHELQHHRQGDTKWLYALMGLKALCYLNPFAHLLVREIQNTQEMACDEKVISSEKVTLEDYIGCLLQVAQTDVSRKIDPVCAAGFCFNNGRHILKRRIEMMYSEQRNLRKWPKLLVMGGLASLLAFTSFASRNFVQDRRITMEEAKGLAAAAASGSDFPLEMNEEILVQLNKYIGTPEGREFMRASLERKKSYQPILDEVTKNYRTPNLLNAIPIAESGYENLPARYSIKAAGLWMFIPPTARKYGMKVNEKVDERLDVRLETDAAHRYLLANKLLFNDWRLALFAYNVGEGRVQKGIKTYGSRDVWELSKHIKGDKDYLAKVMASMIIMKNP